MFTKPSADSSLDDEIAFALAELAKSRDNPEKYADLMDRVARLQKLKAHKSLQPPSLDTVLIVGANIFGILWLARYERENVIKSPKALNFVMRPK